MGIRKQLVDCHIYFTVTWRIPSFVLLIKYHIQNVVRQEKIVYFRRRKVGIDKLVRKFVIHD